MWMRTFSKMFVDRCPVHPSDNRPRPRLGSRADHSSMAALYPAASMSLSSSDLSDGLSLKSQDA